MNPNRSKPTTARDRIVALRDFEKLATLKDASRGDIEEGTLTLRPHRIRFRSIWWPDRSDHQFSSGTAHS